MEKQRGVALVETAFILGTYAIVFFGGMSAGGGDEPHYSLRDGCTMKNIAMDDGSGNRADSYAHCKDLPRVYSGKEWPSKQS